MKLTGYRKFFGKSFRVLCLLAVCFLFFFLNACQLPNFGDFSNTTPHESITVDTETLTLAWDAPSEPVSCYFLYYRKHSNTAIPNAWKAICSLDATPSPEYMLLHSAYGNGEYDFAVIASDSEGTFSDYHSSLDVTAMPETGWYLIWRR